MTETTKKEMTRHAGAIAKVIADRAAAIGSRLERHTRHQNDAQAREAILFLRDAVIDEALKLSSADDKGVGTAFIGYGLLCDVMGVIAKVMDAWLTSQEANKK